MVDDSRNINKNTCYIKHGKKCKDGVCPNGTECCQESDANIAMCCAKGSCDQKGHCSNPRAADCPSTKEGYNGGDQVNSCKGWTFVFTVMLFIIFVLSVGLVIVGLECKNNILQ